MQVLVKFAGPLRGAAGVKQVQVELDGGADTGGLLRRVAELYPAVQHELMETEARNYYSVFINDQLVREKDRETAPLKDGDTVMLLLPIAGG